MGTKYSGQTVAGYNAAPPPDDGTQIAANKMTWAVIKTKLPDPVLALAQQMNTALLNALDVSNTAQTSAYTTLASDHQKPIEVSNGAPIHLASAASVGVGYQVTVVNTDLSLSSLVDLALAANTFDGSVAGSATLAPGQAITVAVNVSINGYYTVARGWGRGGFIVQEPVQFNDNVTIAALKRLYLDGGGDTYIQEVSANVLAEIVAATERKRITAGGYAKFTNSGTYAGVTSSYHEFNQDADGAPVLLLTNSNAVLSGAVGGLQITYSGATPNSSGAKYLYFDDLSGTLRFAADSNGGLRNFSANNVNLSDEQMKVLAGPSDDHTDFVKSLDGLYLKTSYKDSDSGQFDSVTAQSIKAIAPDLVTEFDDGKMGIYGQRLQDRINSVVPKLIARIEALEQQLAALQNP